MKTFAQLAAEDRKVTQHCWRNYRVTTQEAKDKRRLEVQGDKFLADLRYDNMFHRLKNKTIKAGKRVL